MTRCALSSVINQQQNVSFGDIPIVKSSVKEISEMNPTLPKFQFTWNVFLHFHYFRNMQEIHRYPEINQGTGYVDGTYLRRSEGPEHL